MNESKKSNIRVINVEIELIEVAVLDVEEESANGAVRSKEPITLTYERSRE